MNPQEAGFDGTKGINVKLSQILGGGIFKLRRYANAPWEYDEDCRNAPWEYSNDCRNQLIWQESDPPHLFYCNNDDEWFELFFTPIKAQ